MAKLVYIRYNRTPGGDVLRRFSTKTSLFLIIGSGMAVLAMVACVGLVYLNKVDKSWHEFVEVVQGKQRHVMKIRALMGYGGAIHNFKNYVLRGEETYLSTTLQRTQETIVTIDAYRSLGQLREVEKASLQRVREMVVAYSDAAVRVRELRAQGKSAAEIDAHVRIDDAPYLAAMSALSEELDRLTAMQSTVVNRRVRHATLLLSTIASIGGLFFIGFGISLKRGIESTNQALQAENLERRVIEEELKKSERTLQEAETIRDHFVELVFSAQEEERRRIARELHDEAGQALSSLTVGLEQIKTSTDPKGTREQAEKLQTVAEGVIDELARMARGLHPRLLEDLGFIEAVEYQASEIQRIHQLEVQTQAVGLDEAPLAMPIATALYRIIQEALTNVVKHANATTVNLVVSRDASTARVIIEDDGCGFDPNNRSRNGMGLLGIGERVKMLNGSMDIESSKETGTTLAIRIPLKEPAT